MGFGVVFVVEAVTSPAAPVIMAMAGCSSRGFCFRGRESLLEDIRGMGLILFLSSPQTNELLLYICLSVCLCWLL